MCRVYKMAAFLRVTFVVLICWMQRCNGLDARLTIVPNPLTLASDKLDIGGRVTIRCEPPQSSSIQTMLAMTLNKMPTGNPDSTPTALAVATAGSSNEGKAELKAALQGATVDGSVGNKFIQLSLNQTKCADQAMYNCKMSYFDTQDQINSAESNKDFFVDVTPGQLSMKAQRLENGATYDSSAKTEWTVNETLVLTCTGSVGSVRTEDPKTPQLRWMWEYRYSDKNPRDWTLYDGFQTDITSGQQTTRSCYVEQTSILTRKLTVADSGRDYRCVVQRGSIKYDQFAANYSVGTVKEKDSGTDEGAKPDTANVGPIVGGVLGALFIVAIIVIIIYFLVIRPRRQKQAEKYAEDPAKGDGLDAPPAVTADPSVIYTQPNRPRKDKTSEGVTNKALDESDEGKVPRDNDDKRHGRRHKDKKQPPEENPASDEPPAPYNGDLHYAKLDHEQRHGRRNKDAAEDKPRSRRGDDGRRGYDDDRHDYDRRDYDDDRRGHRHRDADDHDEYRQGRQNRGYDYDNNRRRGHHDSSDDGGTDAYINTSTGHGDPNMGTAI